MTTTPEFDRLARALFDGPIKAAHVAVVPGTATGQSSEALSASLYASMTRLGLIVDGQLTDALHARRAP